MFIIALNVVSCTYGTLEIVLRFKNGAKIQNLDGFPPKIRNFKRNKDQ